MALSLCWTTRTEGSESGRVGGIKWKEKEGESEEGRRERTVEFKVDTVELGTSDEICLSLCVCACVRVPVCVCDFWTSLCRYSKCKETNKKCMKLKWMII